LESKPPPRFAHPAEAEFAKILDFYNIDWEYERRTFALEWDEAANVTMAFTPDFYLPEQDLYIELTTLRPSLVTKKNYKQRRMAELYPEINLILLKRKDIRNLMLKFGLDQQAQEIIGTQAQKGNRNEEQA
jgi:hypoxanthine phosphoribosyltransferase